MTTCNIITGDCIEGMRDMYGASVNLIFADPPYNIGIDYGNGVDADLMPKDQFSEWVRRWIDRASGILTDEGSMFVLCNWEMCGNVTYFATENSGLHWRQTIVWRETFGVHCTSKYSRTSRPILWFTKDKRRFTFNRDAILVPSARQTKYGDKRASPKGKTPDDVWDFPRVCGTFKERIPGVPTQVPLALLDRIILGHSNPGDTVFDPFTGSGSTAVAALRRGRNYIGTELSPAFAEIARKRTQIN